MSEYNALLMLDEPIQVAQIQSTNDLCYITYVLILPLQGHYYLHLVEEH